MPADTLFPAPTEHRIGPYMTARKIGKSLYAPWGIHARNGAVIGRVEWYGEWSQYVLSARADAVWSASCMRDVARFADMMTRGAR